MNRYPEVPDRPEDAPSVLDGGHLWIQEKIEGSQLRFRLTPEGTIEFGDRERTFTSGEEPLSLEPAASHVRRSFDRTAFRQAVEDPTDYVFFAVATHRGRLPYDLDRLPPVLGFDIYDAADDSFLSVDAVSSIFDRLGLEPVNALQKELRAVDFHPDRYEFPGSAWYDGPVPGVVIRNKRGGRLQLRNDAVDLEERSDPPMSEGGDEGRTATEADNDGAASAAEGAADSDPRSIAETLCLPELVEAAAAEAETTAFEPVFDRVLDRIVRTHYPRLFGEGRSIDEAAFRSALSSVVQGHLNRLDDR